MSGQPKVLRGRRVFDRPTVAPFTFDAGAGTDPGRLTRVYSDDAKPVRRLSL